MRDKHHDLTAPQHVESAANDTPANDGPQNDGIDRRNFLSCMAWAGTGLLWTMAGGVPSSKLFAATTGAAGGRAAQAASGFSFVQISDSHIGFNKPANQDVTGTLKLALDKINAIFAHPVIGKEFHDDEANFLDRDSVVLIKCQVIDTGPGDGAGSPSKAK